MLIELFKSKTKTVYFNKEKALIIAFFLDWKDRLSFFEPEKVPPECVQRFFAIDCTNFKCSFGDDIEGAYKKELKEAQMAYKGKVETQKV